MDQMSEMLLKMNHNGVCQNNYPVFYLDVDTVTIGLVWLNDFSALNEC